MRFIDVHCHLGEDVFRKDLDRVLKRAEEAGVVAIITSSLTFKDAEFTLQLIRKYRGLVYRTVGLDYTILNEDEVDMMASYIEKNRDTIIGIGEVGLDYYIFRDHRYREKQRKIFSFWIEFAKSLDMPIVVHSRSAGKYALNLLFEHRAERVLMHAFDGRASYAKMAAEKGYYFSIPPSIARSEQKRKLVKVLPMDRLLLETDSPVLAPTKGERNEPANVVVSAEWISRIKGIPIEVVAEMTCQNAEILFGVKF